MATFCGMAVSLPSDFHVHTEFSWDAPHGAMDASCRAALDLGLRSIAFTEHADFVEGVHEGLHPLDVEAYLDELERCRAAYPELRIMSGVELGEPHSFPERTADILARGRPERVLGSVHCAEWNGRLRDASQLRDVPDAEAHAFVRAYFDETIALAQSDAPFEVLTHLDYPKRYWPHARLPYRERDFEEQYRAVLRGLAARGSALEINTTRGIDPARGLCPAPEVLGWWVEAGGRAMSFGSDAHDPTKIAAGFAEAARMVEAAGFRPNDDVTGLWLR